MAGPAPKTQSWTARENLQKDQLVLLVSGQVQVGNTGLAPKLAEGGPLRDPHTLNLELTIEDSGHGGADVEVWMPASLQKDVGEDEYHDVVVRWDGTKIAQFPVVDDREHSALMDKQSKAQNTVAKVVTNKKPTAKKPATEKADKTVVKKVAAKKAAAKKAPKKAAKKAAKKVAPRAVGGWAKGAKKKAVRKAAKKTAKKATKKVARGVKKAKKAKGRKR